MRRKVSFPSVSPLFFRDKPSPLSYTPQFPGGKIDGNSVFWDGGPSILLQESAAAHWEGANDWDNSLMNGGNVETDYDVACTTDDWFIHRYERDMLVINGAVDANTMFMLTSGIVVISDREEGEEMNQAVQDMLNDLPAHKSFPFYIQDNMLRLLAAADDGNADSYGYVEVAVKPGIWQCYLSKSTEGNLLLLLPIQEKTT